MRYLSRMVAVVAAALALVVAGASQTPWVGDETSSVVAHGESRGDQDRATDSESEENEDEYDSGEFSGDDESSSTNDETIADVDVLNNPDEN